jgi:2-C-methyl-D-erythritol 4-phosphate cytidylyltransferase/2-C-methyl-D-erythritol 2,4-cyclodiphosphate synthase
MSPSTIQVVALVAAAGSGSRAGFDIPKQYARVGGEILLRRTLLALVRQQVIDAVQVVIGASDLPLYQEAVAGLPKLLEPVVGGGTRQQSVRLGLEALTSISPDVVLVHDGARPFVNSVIVARVLEVARQGVGAIPALPVLETVKRISGDVVVATVPRDDLVAAQTPQGFPFAALLAANRKAAEAGRDDLTDDAAVAALAGLPVRVVAGERGNIKLTIPEDFAMGDHEGSRIETRSAQGFDVHAFGPGESVWLCGVNLPHDRGLVGHSDADVGLHAVTDALLGTIGDGDIGTHFPPSDPAWKGASSDRFLADAVRRIALRGGRIINLDVTLLCERPKIGPHRDLMRAAMARIAGIDVGRVSVKATTTERLGFTGRGEGIAALACATVELPRDAE